MDNLLEGHRGLAETKVYVRDAHRYTYRGDIHEETRVGYAYAFHLFVRGQGSVVVAGKPYPVGNGSLVFIRPGEAHSFHLTSPSSLEAYNIYCDLWGRPERLFSHFAFQTSRPDPQFMPPAVSCPELDTLPTCARVPVHSPLTDWFVRICGWHGSLDGNAEALVSSRMKAWLLQAHNELRSEAPYDRRIARILERMEREPEARFSYQEMSRECGLEKSHFYSLFKSVTGMTPKGYQLRLKMKKAAALLLESDQSVTRISEQLGYDTVHYFSKQFAEFHRLSPTRYRTLRRGGGDWPI
ncbi:AraC family transcriptional regulator [Paenibacillaceae bacterium WGS1546]|uniref:AraC family transcriptional regulator n=1 Tax=Cohnella sp. WGS1546 TaxID=3366810 RepID=UPI00372D1E17